MKADRRALSRGMLVTSMVIFGTIGVARTYIPLPSGMLAMARGAIGTLFLVLYMAVRRRRPDIALLRPALRKLCVSGVMIGFNWILLFEAYRYTSVATATLCYYMAPVFVTLASPLVLHERLTLRKGVCVLAAVIGMIPVSGIMQTGGVGDLKGVVCGLGAGALYACIMLTNKTLPPLPAESKTVVQLSSASVVLLPYTLLAGEWKGAEFTASAMLLVLLVGVVHTGIAYAMYFGSMEHLSAQTLAILSYLDPVVAVILSAAVLHQPLDAAGWVGAVLILGAAAVSELPPRKTPVLPKIAE